MLYFAVLLVIVNLYTFPLAICTYITGKRNGSLMYNKRAKKWEVWLGTKAVSTKVDVLKIRGNPWTLMYRLLTVKN
jgi:hypothetical protein